MSRHRLPASERVLPLILRFLTYSRIAQQFHEVDPAFASGAFKPGKKFIAYMCAVTVFARMPRPGVVHIDIVRHIQTGTKHAFFFQVKVLFLLCQYPTNLPFGDIDLPV